MDLGSIVNAYWKKNKLGLKSGETDENDSSLSVTEILGVLEHLNISQSPASKLPEKSLITPANASINIFKQKFEKRLGSAAERYSNAVKAIKRDTSNSSSLPKVSLNEMKIAAEELTQICSMLGGMYNSPSSLSDNINPLTKISGNNSDIYQNSCKNISCIQTASTPTQSIVMPINLNEKLNNESAYTNYQCANKADYRQIIQGLNDKLSNLTKANPEICPPATNK